jgi:hypothetical protein
VLYKWLTSSSCFKSRVISVDYVSEDARNKHGKITGHTDERENETKIGSSKTECIEILSKRTNEKEVAVLRVT